ncbi:unnamed protein product [Spirodela intermedia]|uniref:Uncharacterized protein n=1 Tax=Spirodela intermedia TaxID=51605 RepID=A0A7I8L769_SPIIN|nr:unnamed protein product [Spirodela intermedia]
MEFDASMPTQNIWCRLQEETRDKILGHKLRYQNKSLQATLCCSL